MSTTTGTRQLKEAVARADDLLAEQKVIAMAAAVSRAEWLTSTVASRLQGEPFGQNRPMALRLICSVIGPPVPGLMTRGEWLPLRRAIVTRLQSLTHARLDEVVSQLEAFLPGDSWVMDARLQLNRRAWTDLAETLGHLRDEYLPRLTA